MASCTCKTTDSLDDVRDALLKRLLAEVDGGVAADAIRNLATAYGILTDKKHAGRGYPYTKQLQRTQ